MPYNARAEKIYIQFQPNSKLYINQDQKANNLNQKLAAIHAALAASTRSPIPLSLPLWDGRNLAAFYYLKDFLK
jgi:hypothetical protein